MKNMNQKPVIGMYLTDHAYQRICERMNMTKTKAEVIEMLNIHSTKVSLFGRVMRIPGYNIDIRYTVLEQLKYVCTTIVAVYRPTYQNHMPKHKTLHIKWIDSIELGDGVNVIEAIE